MEFFKRWLLTFIALGIVVIVVTLITIIFCWLYQSAIGQLILIMIGVSLMMTFIDLTFK
jgi:hypothetical protein